MPTAVVICAYTLDRWEQLVLSVESVLRQEPPHETVLVIDNNEALRERAAAAWPAVQVIANAGPRGLSSARNTALAVIDADVVAFLDDDAWAEDGWLAGLVAPFDDPLVVATGGRAEPIWPRQSSAGPSAQAPAILPPELLWIVGCSYRGLPEEPADVRNVMGCSMAFRAAPLRALGGFNPDTGRVGRLPIGCEETEVCIRLTDADPARRIRHVPGATVHHHVSSDRVRLRYLLHRSWCEGLSKAAISRTVGRRSALASESAYVSGVLPRGMLRALAGGPRTWAGAPAIALSLAAAVGGYVRGVVAGAALTAPIDVREPAAT